MDAIFKIDSKDHVKLNTFLHGTLKFLLTASFKKKIISAQDYLNDIMELFKKI